MISDKLKRIIFNELYIQLKEVEIIPYCGSVWFINRSEKYWYLELNSNNHLWWRYSFFVDFFEIFSLEIREYEPLIREWTEWVLNRRVLRVDALCPPNSKLIGDVLNYKITKTGIGYYGHRQIIENMINTAGGYGDIDPRNTIITNVLNKIISTSDYVFTDVVNDEVNKILEQTDEELKCEIMESNHSEYNIDFISSYNALTSFEGTVKLIDNIESSSFARSILTESIEVILNQPDV